MINTERAIARGVSNRRLLKLAAFLRTLPRKRFDYNRWVGRDWGGAPDLSCGTTGCALGWAATMPAFQRLGLRLAPDGIPSLLGRIHEPYTSATLLFGIPWFDAQRLFSPSDGEERATPKYVARKIERYVRTR